MKVLMIDRPSNRQEVQVTIQGTVMVDVVDNISLYGDNDLRREVSEMVEEFVLDHIPDDLLKHVHFSVHF